MSLAAQVFQPTLPAPPQPAKPSANPNQKFQLPHPDAPAANFVNVYAETSQEVNGSVRRLRGNAYVETTDMKIAADEIDYNDDTTQVDARGHVHFENFMNGDKVDCDEAHYNIDDQKGIFSGDVTGSAPAQATARPGVLTSTNPYYFQGEWAERIDDHYILHNGLLTDCIVPRPWWIFKGPLFDIVPGDRALIRHSWFYLGRIRLFYVPYFYKSLKREPRRSGFFLPSVGDDSLHGPNVGFGFFWAINRSYDLSYFGQDFAYAGLANHMELRGDPNQKTTFDLNVFGIDDTQVTIPTQSGVRVTMQGSSDLGNGWEARGNLDYLSSFAFLQNFTQSFYEAVFSETHSVGFVDKHWSDFGLDFVADRNVNFQSVTPGDFIEIRKLPEVDFNEREHEIDLDNFPVWFSFESSGGLMDRSQALFETPQFVDRMNFAPQVSTAFHWNGIDLIPTVGLRETEYGASFVNGQPNGGQPSGNSLLLSSRNVSLDLVLPSLERVFKAPSWMGDKAKHIIEPRITYKYVTGIDNFDQIIRFDENDLFTDTNQVEFSLTNRLLVKDKAGTVTDFLTWQILYDRYFNPTFGGAVLPCQAATATTATTCLRNVIASSIDLDGYAFLDGPRNYSPIVSDLRIQSKVGFEWRTDYDPLFHEFTNTGVSVDGRVRQYFWSVGDTFVKSDPVLAPNSNQAHVLLGYGNPNRRGWNAGYSIYYDYVLHTLQFWQAQATYNTDCCGLSFQYRRFSIGTRDDSQFEVAFALSNIGTFGNLKRQDRMF